MANGNGYGRLQEEIVVTNKRIDNLEKEVKRSNGRLEALVERGFAELRQDMARLIGALAEDAEKKTQNSRPTSKPTRSTLRG